MLGSTQTVEPRLAAGLGSAQVTLSSVRFGPGDSTVLARVTRGLLVDQFCATHVVLVLRPNFVLALEHTTGQAKAAAGYGSAAAATCRWLELTAGCSWLWFVVGCPGCAGNDKWSTLGRHPCEGRGLEASGPVAVPTDTRTSPTAGWSLGGLGPRQASGVAAWRAPAQWRAQGPAQGAAGHSPPRRPWIEGDCGLHRS